MIKQRESAVYLSFFRENLWLIVIPAVALTTMGFLYRQSLPVRYRLNTFWEMDYQTWELPQKTLLTDEAVTALRTDVLTSGRSFSAQNSIRLYKVGPVAVNVEIEGAAPEGLRADLNELEIPAETKYGFHRRGDVGVGAKKAPVLIFELTGLTAGLLLGLIASLIKTYLRKY